MRLSRRESDGADAFGRIDAGKMFVMFDRGDYWQCAYVIRKGAADEIKAQGLDAFRDAVAGVAPLMRDRVQELRTLGRRQAPHRQDRSPGAMASAGTAVHRRCGARDVAGRRRRHQPRGPGCGGGRQPSGRRRCAAGTVSDDDLAAVQRRRMFPTRMTQALPGVRAEQCPEPRAGRPHDAGAAMAGAAGQRLPDAAAHSGAAGRAGRAARTCAGYARECASTARLTRPPAPWRNSNLSESGRDASC